MKIDYHKYNTFIFDLDKTLWDTVDKYGQSIWAKQMIPPFAPQDTAVTDDVGSRCVMKPGVREYLNFLFMSGKKIGFLSTGLLWGVTHEEQPSIKMLKYFSINDFFNFKRALLYKTDLKIHSLKDIGDCIFFDDNDEVISRASTLENVRVIDSKEITDWASLI